MGESLLFLGLTLLWCPKGISSLLLCQLPQVSTLPKIEFFVTLSQQHVEDFPSQFEVESGNQGYLWDPLVSHGVGCIVSSE